MKTTTLSTLTVAAATTATLVLISTTTAVLALPVIKGRDPSGGYAGCLESYSYAFDGAYTPLCGH